MIIQALYYALPGLVANMMPILVKSRFKYLDRPVDFGLMLGNKPIFGRNKTYRGLVLGLAGGVAVAYLQMLISEARLLTELEYLNYEAPVMFGLVLGGGALLGDLVKSFFKRRLGIEEGKRFLPWDQMDYVIGIVLFSFLLKPMTGGMIATLMIAGPLLSIAATRIGYALGLRKEKW